MSANSTNGPATADGVADPSTTLFSFWTRWMEQSAQGTQAMLELFNSAGDLQRLQRTVLDPISRSIEDFMRTPAFLEAMKRNLKAVTDARLLQDQVVRHTAREIGHPTTADVTGLFDRLHSTEEVIVTRLKAIEDRLKAVEDRLNAAPATKRSSNRAAEEAASS
jgi:hypothetical protein